MPLARTLEVISSSCCLGSAHFLQCAVAENMLFARVTRTANLVWCVQLQNFRVLTNALVQELGELCVSPKTPLLHTRITDNAWVCGVLLTLTKSQKQVN
jgi:hypothetical protein